MKRWPLVMVAAGLISAAFLMAGCAGGVKYLNVNYQVPSEVMGFKEPAVFLEVRDERFNSSLIGPEAAAKGLFNDYSDMMVDLKVQKIGSTTPDLEMYNLSVTKLTEEAVRQRLAAMGIQVAPAPIEGQPNLVVVIESLMIELKGGDLVAEAAFRADMFKTKKHIIKTSAKADSQRIKLIGAMGAAKALTSAFNNGLNSLDFSGLNKL